MYGFPEGRDNLLGMIRRATLLDTDDSGSQQMMRKLRGLRSEFPEDVYRPQPHGLSSHAPAGSEGVLIALGGRSDRLLGIGFEHKDHRPRDLPRGATVLYDDKGNIVYLKSADGVAIEAKVGKVTIEAKAGEITIEAKSGKVSIKPSAGQNVYLGGDGADGTYARVMTESGPSANVFAKV